ncbi:hypothetical protein J8K13_001800, partial [Campylobacter coli]|nr:hypothetical protein [Campylobacter coli]
VSNGAISDNSAGVKVLSLDEMKEVKGGYYFKRAPNFDYGTGIRSYAYIVTDADNSQLQISSNSTVLAKYRYVNNQKEYYLQSYNNGTLGTIFPNYSTSWGQYAMDIMRDFKSKY